MGGRVNSGWLQVSATRRVCWVLAMPRRLSQATPEAANQGGCEPGIWTYFRGTRSQWTRVRYRWLRAPATNTINELGPFRGFFQVARHSQQSRWQCQTNLDGAAKGSGLRRSSCKLTLLGALPIGSTQGRETKKRGRRKPTPLIRISWPEIAESSGQLVLFTFGAVSRAGMRNTCPG